jgi:L-fuconolactonase
MPDEHGAVDPRAAFDDVLALAERQNVSVKWSHAPYLFDVRSFPFDDLMPFLRRAIDAFGKEWLMCASDISMNTTGRR